ncbi:MAG: hypothetical protein ABIG34_00070 [Candidatus Peregrinibacteria bacterium]
MKKGFFFVGLILPFVIVVAFQWFVDPIYIFGRREGSFWWWKQPRISIAFVTRKVKGEALSMGSSRNANIPSTHNGWDGMRVMKIVLPAATYTEERQYLEHAQAVHPLKKVTVEMSYSNIDQQIPAQFNPDRLLHITEPTNQFRYNLSIVTDIARALFSADTIQEGVLEFLRVSFEEHVRYYERISSFKKIFKIATNGIPQKQDHPMDELRKMLEFSAAHDIETFFFITPLWAPKEESEVSRFGFDTLEQWKRDLVTLFEEEERKSGKTFALWDFSGYNTVTLEEMPASGNISNTRWFWDISHFKEITGEMILDRIFGTCTEPCAIPEDFGVRLTPENIEEHLAKVREDRARYLQEHPVSKQK